MSIDSLIAISNALSVSTDAILFGEITYDKEPYYKEFTDIILDYSDKEKKYKVLLLSITFSSFYFIPLKSYPLYAIFSTFSKSGKNLYHVINHNIHLHKERRYL